MDLVISPTRAWSARGSRSTCSATWSPLEAPHGCACQLENLTCMLASKEDVMHLFQKLTTTLYKYDTKPRRRSRRDAPSIAARKLTNGAPVLVVSRLRTAVIHHMSHQNLPGIGTAARAAEGVWRVSRSKHRTNDKRSAAYSCKMKPANHRGGYARLMKGVDRDCFALVSRKPD